MSDDAIHTRIQQLIDAEHDLRRRLTAGEIDSDAEQARLKAIEVQLDQTWDLLRQRRAKREFGRNPDEAATRSAATVEGYTG